MASAAQICMMYMQDADSSDDETYAAVISMLLDLFRASIRRRTYLTLPALVSRTDSPWIRLLRSAPNKSFICATGFTRPVFRWLAAILEAQKPARANPNHGGVRSIGPKTHTALVLHFLGSMMQGKYLQMLFGLPPSTLSRYLREGIKLLRTGLRSDPLARIAWPSKVRHGLISHLHANRVSSGRDETIWRSRGCTGPDVLQHLWLHGRHRHGHSEAR